MPKKKWKVRRKERLEEKEQGEEGEKTPQERGKERHEEKEKEKKQGGSSERVPENTGAVTAAETTVEPAMPRKFTIPEHEQRFKSKWNAGRQKALLGAGTFAQVF